MIIFEIEHHKFIMLSEEQAMKAFEVFKGAIPIEWDHKLTGKAKYRESASHPEVSISVVPDEQLLKNNEEKRPEGQA